MNWKLNILKDGNRYCVRGYTIRTTRENQRQFKRSYNLRREAEDFIWRFNGDDDFRNEFLESKGLPVESYWLKKRNEKDAERKRNQTTFADAYHFYHSNEAIRLASGTLRTAEGYWREFGSVIGALPACRVTSAWVATFEAEMAKKGNSQATINRKVAFIRRVLSYAFNHELIAAHPLERYKLKKAPQAHPEHWREDEYKSFLSFADRKYPVGSKNRWIYVAYLTALYTGVRAGELWALTPRKLDATGVMFVDRQFELVSKQFRHTKGKVGRPVPVSDLLRVELDALARAKQLKPDDLYFQSSCGKPICHNNFKNRVFARDVEEWGGRRITMHGLRHTSATAMCNQGIPASQVQMALGHADLKTTQRYVKMLAEDIAAIGKTFVICPAQEEEQSVESVGVRGMYGVGMAEASENTQHHPDH